MSLVKYHINTFYLSYRETIPYLRSNASNDPPFGWSSVLNWNDNFANAFFICWYQLAAIPAYVIYSNFTMTTIYA